MRKTSSITNRDGSTMAVIPLQRNVSVLVRRESSVREKDSEVDWRDKLRQWNKV